MKKLIQSFFDNEVLAYIFFGVATTLVSVIVRLLSYALTKNELLATAIGNGAGILFAFITNDTIVFKQARAGWLRRLGKFIAARFSTFLLDMALTFLFVTSFPGIIGQFVNHDMQRVNQIETLLAQALIIVLNYIFSKIFVFRTKKKAWG